MEQKIRVFTAFSGYDSQCLALERLKRDFPGFDYELVGWAEIDKYAIQGHNALFPQWAPQLW
jgi:DNA (cytosine-5)-methyltransferase 1